MKKMSDRSTISKPAYWVWGLGIVGLAVGIGLILTVGVPLLAGFIGLIMALNVFQMLGLAWGFEIEGDTFRVWFPLWPSRNRSLGRQDIAHVEVVHNPIRIFRHSDFMRLRLADGKKLILPRIGTSHFQMLVDHLQPKEQ